MEDDDRRKLQVTKLEAAKRQLDCAIELWFTGKDEVSVYTLAAAANEVIQDVNKHRKTGFEAIYNSKIIRDEYRKEWMDLVRKPVNFFKHADRDPEGSVEFSVAGSLMFLVYAVHGLGYLKERSSDHERFFFTWLLLHKPTFIREESRELLDENFGVQHLDALRELSKKEFFEMMSEAASKAEKP